MNATDLKINRILQISAYFTFFALSTIYFYWFSSYIFFYQEKSMLFLTSFSYLSEHLNQPGGFLIWLAELQTAFYFYPLAGALIVSIEICLVIFLTSKIGKVLKGKTCYLIPFLSGAVLFYLQTNYQYLAYNNLGILLQILMFYLVIRLLEGTKMWIPVLLFPGWYLLTGSFSFIFFILLIIQLVVVRGKENWIKVAVLFFTTIQFFYISSEFLFFQTIRSLLEFPFLELNTGSQNLLFFAVVLLISFSPLVFRIHFKSIYNFKIRKFQIVQTLPFLVIAIFAFLSVSRIDKKNSHYFRWKSCFMSKTSNN